ncbi:hypothetical protein T440DRAFT_193349 [Plenodomus tracheiphilus IPT5]|uniref:Uncharacterized protein n=1 Tax=Plenodomus tracheiphilus IPT5 TaxID=1408161 RepID=A0A6A7AYM9_9PLEO|nr:hypothetical protein T440DRAFT_193349 [Plenodomus tracheiphilus IPT5]
MNRALVGAMNGLYCRDYCKGSIDPETISLVVDRQGSCSSGRNFGAATSTGIPCGCGTGDTIEGTEDRPAGQPKSKSDVNTALSTHSAVCRGTTYRLVSTENGLHCLEAAFQASPLTSLEVQTILTGSSSVFVARPHHKPRCGSWIVVGDKEYMSTYRQVYGTRGWAQDHFSSDGGAVRSRAYMGSPVRVSGPAPHGWSAMRMGQS